MNLVSQTVRSCGARLLLGALAILLAGSQVEGPSSARADNKKPGAKALKPPKKIDVPKNTPVLPKPHPNAKNHPPVLAALSDLEEAFGILANHASPLLGDNRLIAMERIRIAFVQINKGIAGPLGMNQSDNTVLRGLPAGNDFPSVRKALGKIRDAQNELKKVKPNLWGERTAAIVTLNYAIRDLDKAMNHARSLDK